MPTANLTKAALLMLCIVVVSLISWEYMWRHKGYDRGFNDDVGLWRKNRLKVYQPQNEATVFIGSSRIKFDLDIPTWEKTTGEKAVQLALHGSNPRPALVDLGNDENFKGKLVIDITEGLFFGPRPEIEMNQRVQYGQEASPAQKAGDQISFALEHQFTFLQKDLFSLNAMLTDLRIPNRKGVRGDIIFPPKFSYVTFDRQEILTDTFVKDSAMLRWQTDIWTMFGALSDEPGAGGDTLQKILEEVKTAVAKIIARGGKVIFVRTPSSGGYWAHEPIQYPREKYYDQLLRATGCKGIHFQDYPDMANFICPEWSHLTKEDAVEYTQALIKALQQQNWFSNPR